MATVPRYGLYAIADTGVLAPARLPEAIAEAIAGGAVMIQLRDKHGNRLARLMLARTLREICNRSQVPFIVNDDPELARAIGADGVHLGRADPSCAEARKLLGPDAIIGVSCYNDIAAATAAVADGADYAAFGRFFDSRTKPSAPPASMDTLRAAKQRLKVPVVAIGGITLENSRLVLEAGADLLAVVSGVFAQEDIRGAAAGFRKIIGEFHAAPEN
jgi:thiamine-phosphate pyrophosphorylase